jgi:hypothetical protein
LAGEKQKYKKGENYGYEKGLSKKNRGTTGGMEG